MKTAFTEFPRYGTTHDAYLGLLENTLAQPKWVSGTVDRYSVGSRFGSKERRTKELVCATFGLTNSRARLINAPSRNLNLAFAFANVLWTLSGSNDVEAIAFYNARGREFSDGGKHFSCALGHRMQAGPSGSQLDAVVKTLRHDPTSRRAVIQFYSTTDSVLRPRDTPCALSMHFFIRSERLVAITHMRSQSALVVFPYDIVLFTMIHEFVARGAGVPPGEYIHTCDSLHIYEDEEEFARTTIAECRHLPPPSAMPEMPGASFSHIEYLCRSEERLRQGVFAPLVISAVESQYWRDILYTIALAHSDGPFVRLDNFVCRETL